MRQPSFLTGIFSEARIVMKKKLAYIQENAIVVHRKAPNLEKNIRSQKKRGTAAATLVIIPLRTEIPICSKQHC